MMPVTVFQNRDTFALYTDKFMLNSINRRTFLAKCSTFGSVSLLSQPTDVLIAAASVNINDFMASGDGVADDTDALERAIQSGAVNIIIPEGTYRISHQITIPSGINIIGLGSPIIALDTATFDETSVGNSYAANACALMFLGNAGGGVYGITFTPTRYAPELTVMAIAIRSSKDVTVSGCTFKNFSKTKIVRIDSSMSCRIHGNKFSESFLDSEELSQLTCIDVDDNIISGASSKIYISNNFFNEIKSSNRYALMHGDQTDAINISNSVSSEHTICNNFIRMVGEGIDCFGNNCAIINNTMIYCRNYGVKLVHGARGNRVERNTIILSGLGGIVIAGSHNASHDTQENIVTDNVIGEIRSDEIWSNADTFGIKLEDDHGIRLSRLNTIVNNTIYQNNLMNHAILSSDNSSENTISGNSIIIK